MDAKARKALVDSLADAKNFDASYNEVNRRWMVGKITGVFEGRGESDAAIKSKTTAAVMRARTAVKKHRDFKLGFKLSNNKEAATERTLKLRRIEILNALIAHDPELADVTHEPQLLFVAKRRYRVIERFQFFVNPNGRGYFLYPEDCKGNHEWRVNTVGAQNHWARKTTAYLPIELIVPPDPPDILAAIDSLFTRSKTFCKANLLDCEATLSILYMDSLREAKSPKTLLDKLYAQQGSRYLCVDRATRPPVFSADKTPQGLFTVADRPQADMSVGDHCYIFNHGLYQVLLPGGSWRGEHAIVTDCGDRVVSSGTGFKFMGHGLPRGGEPGSMPRFYSNLLNELNTFLYRSYRIGAIFLHYMKSGGTAFPGAVTKQTKALADPGGTSRSVDFYFFDLDFNYPNYLKKVVKGKGPPKNFEHGFVVWHINATRQFGIHRKTTLADAIAAGLAQDKNRPIFRRPNAPATAAEMFDAIAWMIPYPGPSGVETPHFVFQKKGAGIEMLKLEMADLYKQPFFRFGATNTTDMWVTRPKVDVGSTYTSFLTASGAI